MGLFDKFRKKNSGLTIEEIIANDYEQKYFDTGVVLIDADYLSGRE